MVNKRVTLSLDSNSYENYTNYCRENAMIVSKKVELFMKKELEEAKNARK